MRCFPCLPRRRRGANRVTPVSAEEDSTAATPGHARQGGDVVEPHGATHDAPRSPASRLPLSETLQANQRTPGASVSAASGEQRRRPRPLPMGLSRASSVQLMEAMASPRSDGRPKHLYGSLLLRPAGPGSVPDPDEDDERSVADNAAAADHGAKACPQWGSLPFAAEAHKPDARRARAWRHRARSRGGVPIRRLKRSWQRVRRQQPGERLAGERTGRGGSWHVPWPQHCSWGGGRERGESHQRRHSATSEAIPPARRPRGDGLRLERPLVAAGASEPASGAAR